MAVLIEELENLKNITGSIEPYEDGTLPVDHEFIEIEQDLVGCDLVRRIMPNCVCPRKELLPPGEELHCGHCEIKAKAVENGFQPLDICTQRDKAYMSSGWSVGTFQKV